MSASKHGSSEDDIDRLYQLPLAEFTAARNALAKSSGSDGAGIRALEKPNLAVWAVNQLYWRKRTIYNKLIAAAEARQKAHAKLLSGKSSDIAGADSAHSTALRAAADAAREILKDAGHDESHTIANAVNETLQALPGSGTPGRLTEPLKPAGFEALAGLVKGSVHVPKLVPRNAPAPAAADDQKRERHETEKSLREARNDAKAAETSLNATRRDLARAKEERQRLQDQLQFAIKKVEDTSTELREREQQAARATQEVTRLEAKLETLN